MASLCAVHLLKAHYSQEVSGEI